MSISELKVMRQYYVISSWFFNVYMDAVMKEVKMGMGRMGMRLCSLLYVDDLVLCGKSEEDLKVMLRYVGEKI